MKKVQISYRPTFLGFYLKKRLIEIQLPESYDEMTANQLLAFCSGNIDYLLLSFLNLGLFKKFTVLKRLNVAQRNEIISSMTFLSEKPKMKKWIFKVGKRNPGDMLQHINLFWYGVLENLYNDYVTEKNEDGLNEIISILFTCSPKDAQGLNPLQKHAILFNYAAIHNFIIAECDTLYPQTAVTEQPEPTNWLRISDEMAGDKVGTYEQVLGMNCFAILQLLNDRAERAETQNRPENEFEKLINQQ